MFDGLMEFFCHWATLTAALWLASHLMRGVRFDSFGSLLAAALLLGFATTFVRPLVILLTLPFTLVTLGLFLLVINGLMVKLVTWLVRGFHVDGLWRAVLVSLLVALSSLTVNYLLAQDEIVVFPHMEDGENGAGTWT